MKHLRIIFFLFISALSVNAFGADYESGDTAIVNVTSMDTTDFPVQLMYNENGVSRFVKGVQIKKGTYQFAVPVKGYEKAEIFIRSPFSILMNNGGFMPQPRPAILLGDGKIVNVKADFKNQLNIKVNSTDPEIKLFETYAQQERKFDELSWEKIKERATAGSSEEKKKEINQDLNDIRSKLHEVKLSFVKKDRKSFAALVVFASYYQGLNTKDALSTLQSIAPSYRNSPLWISLFNKLNAGTNTDVGNVVPAFSGTDIHGNTFNSNQLHGKYYLIDFWGSWCMPCRKSHPRLKEIYNKYHSKGFEIVSVAYENGSKEAQQREWRKAVKADGLNWVNLLNSSANNLIKQFGITSYPTKLLVNPEGKIILRVNESADEIEKKLSRALK